MFISASCSRDGDVHWGLVRRILSTRFCSHAVFLCVQVAAVPKSCHGSASFSTKLFRIKTPQLETFSLFPILFGERTQLHFIYESDLFLSFHTLLPPAFLADFAFTLIFLIPPRRPLPIPFHFLWSLLGHVLSVWWGFYSGIIFILPKAYKPYWSLSFVKRSESEAKITCNTMMCNLSGISVLFFTVTELSPPQFFLIKHLFARKFLFQSFHFLWWGLVLWVAWEKRHIFIL